MNEELFKRYKKALEGLTVGGNDTIKNLQTEHRKIYSMPILEWMIRKLI